MTQPHTHSQGCQKAQASTHDSLSLSVGKACGGVQAKKQIWTLCVLDRNPLNQGAWGIPCKAHYRAPEKALVNIWNDVCGRRN